MLTSETTRKKLSPAALAQLLDRRQAFVGFVEKHVGSHELAEDIVQAAFVRGLERGDELQKDESVVAWFYRILRNAVIDAYRKNAATERALESFRRELPPNAVVEEPIRNQICQCVGPLMDSLKPEYKAALDLVDLKDGTLRELATEQGITENNAAVRVHRARRALLKQVRKTCGSCSEHGCVDCRCKKSPAGSLSR
jgi:RNA polymerase sigma-70 factor, ECF subfamily